MCGLCFVIQFFVSYLVFNLIDAGERAGCITLIVFLKSCDWSCYAAFSHGVVGWPVMCDCDIS